MDESRDCAEEVLSRDPKNLDGLLAMAGYYQVTRSHENRMLARVGYRPEISYLERAAKVATEPADWRMIYEDLADLYAKVGNAKVACNYQLKYLLALHDEEFVDATKFWNAGQHQEFAQSMDQARIAAKKALRMDPNNLQGLLAMANYYDTMEARSREASARADYRDEIGYLEHAETLTTAPSDKRELLRRVSGLYGKLGEDNMAREFQRRANNVPN